MDSEHKNIEELLDKYWNCQTTLEEEQQLRHYFSTAHVPESLKEAAALFMHFEQSRNKTLDKSFDARVVRNLRTHRGRRTLLVYNTMRIAAGIAVLVLAIWLIRPGGNTTRSAEFADTYNDPNKAFEETKKALMMISRSFSTAEEQVKKITIFNEAQQEIRSEKEDTKL